MFSPQLGENSTKGYHKVHLLELHWWCSTPSLRVLALEQERKTHISFADGLGSLLSPNFFPPILLECFPHASNMGILQRFLKFWLPLRWLWRPAASQYFDRKPFYGVPGVGFSRLSVCFLLRSWSLGPGMDWAPEWSSLLSRESTSPSPSPSRPPANLGSLSQINKWSL